MKLRIPITIATFLLCAGLASTAQANIISFDGGTLSAGGTVYEENGFRVKTIGGEAYFGDYYGVGNNVMHAHWAAGGFGSITKIVFSKADGTAFDLNYFVLTSNTDTGGGPASGNEKAYIHASDQTDGSTSDYSQLLPVEDWGFPASQIYLGTPFDNVKSFWFDVTDIVACFGMDSFYINETAPPRVNGILEPSTITLTSLSLLILNWRRRRAAA